MYCRKNGEKKSDQRNGWSAKKELARSWQMLECIALHWRKHKEAEYIIIHKNYENLFKWRHLWISVSASSNCMWCNSLDIFSYCVEKRKKPAVWRCELLFLAFTPIPIQYCNDIMNLAWKPIHSAQDCCAPSLRCKEISTMGENKRRFSRICNTRSQEITLHAVTVWSEAQSLTKFNQRNEICMHFIC